MEILVATVGHLGNDPRSSNIVNSVIDADFSTEVIEMQTIRPPLRVMIRQRACTHIISEDSGINKVNRSWCSRNLARESWLLALHTVDNHLEPLIDITDVRRQTGPDAFWLNQFAIAYESLNAYLHANVTLFPKVIIAEDLPSAAAAVLLKESAGWKIIYDAHELFTESLVLANEAHSKDVLEFFRTMELMVWKNVDSLISVSPGISDFIHNQAPKRRSVVLPNFAPLHQRTDTSHRAQTEVIQYVYAGGAAPFRQVDVLVNNWPDDKDGPQLHLYLAPSRLADDVVRIANQKSNIYVHEMVLPNNLINELAKFDVGVVPYKYPYPYDMASPNKFGEYLAADLAILSEEGTWVAHLVKAHGLGVCGSFGDATELRETLNLLDRSQLNAFRVNASKSFHASLNWDCYISEVFDEINSLLERTDGETRKKPLSKTAQLTVSQLLGVCLEVVIEQLRPFLVAIYGILRGHRLSRFVPRRLIQRFA